MARRKRFCDGAGYTQHCWECIHAKGWCKGQAIAGAGDDLATCDIDGRRVGKYDSPNNPSSIAGGCGCYGKDDGTK